MVKVLTPALCVHCRLAEAPGAGGWLTREVCVTGDHHAALQGHCVSGTLYFKDLLEVIRTECGQPAYHGHFVWDAGEEFTVTGQRIYNEPWQAGGLLLFAG